jgi:hypothetical protein
MYFTRVRHGGTVLAWLLPTYGPKSGPSDPYTGKMPYDTFNQYRTQYRLDTGTKSALARPCVN